MSAVETVEPLLFGQLEMVKALGYYWGGTGITS